MWAKRLSTALLVFTLSILPAYAGSSTISLFDSGLAARIYDVITDAAGHFIAEYGLCDGVAAAQCAAVKAASTAPLATDPALVVTISPNSPTQPVSAASLPLPTGAATAALQTTLNSTLGSPFQAGGSIGNTSFAATQATASNLNATVVGTGTFATQLTGATNNINNIAGTVSLPTGAATSANQTTANGSLATIATNTGGATPAGSNTIGGVTQSSGPWTFNLTQWAGGTLGAMANYGTSPGAVLVPGVNANVTNITTKPASTAPLASDPSQVVSISPNVAPSTACSSTAMEASHICKASAGNLYGFYCNVIGGAAGWCIAYNSATVPGTGALTGAQVLDNCQFAAGSMGCSLGRIPFPRQYGTGIVVLVSTAANPFTFTTGTDTAYISADFQ